MSRVEFGICYVSSDDPIAAECIAAWKAIGFTRVRLTLAGDQIFKTQGAPDWSNSDAIVASLRAAGLRYGAGLYSLPAWMSEGKPTYEGYDTGCWNIVTDPATGIPVNVKAKTDGPYCGVNAAHINADAVRMVGMEMAKRYPDADSWSAWNEWNGYWPPSMAGLPRDEDLDRYFDELLIPFTQGVRTVLPGAVMTLMQADGADILRRVLTMERDRGLRLGDRITFHPYGDPAKWPDDSYAALDDYWRVVTKPDNLRAGRPMDADEIGAPKGRSIAEWLQHVLWLRTVDQDTYADLFDFSRITLLNDNGLLNPDFTLTDEGEKVKALIATVSRFGR